MAYLYDFYGIDFDEVFANRPDQNPLAEFVDFAGLEPILILNRTSLNEQLLFRLGMDKNDWFNYEPYYMFRLREEFSDQVDIIMMNSDLMIPIDHLWGEWTGE